MKRLRRLFLVIFLCGTALVLHGQRYTVSGLVTDASNGESVKSILVTLMAEEDKTQVFTSFPSRSSSQQPHQGHAA